MDTAAMVERIERETERETRRARRRIERTGERDRGKKGRAEAEGKRRWVRGEKA